MVSRKGETTYVRVGVHAYAQEKKTGKKNGEVGARVCVCMLSCVCVCVHAFMVHVCVCACV